MDVDDLIFGDEVTVSARCIVVALDSGLMSAGHIFL